MTTRDELREAVARAICHKAHECTRGCLECERYFGEADAALSAIEREHVIVPRSEWRGRIKVEVKARPPFDLPTE